MRRIKMYANDNVEMPTKTDGSRLDRNLDPPPAECQLSDWTDCETILTFL